MEKNLDNQSNPTSNDSRLAANPVDAPSWPTEDEIRRRAYENFLSRRREPGHNVDDWQQAEQELIQENSHPLFGHIGELQVSLKRMKNGRGRV